jgi:phosphate transport system protein
MAQTEHIVKSYEAELAALDAKIAQMGGLAEQLLAQAYDAVERRDATLAEQTIAQDALVDAMERQVEEQAVSMIARRQPMALDLRQIMAGIKVASDLERVGDLAKNLAKRALAIQREQHPKSVMVGLRHMVDLALGQLKDVLDAYSERNVEKAVDVWNRDEQIDAMYNSIFRELLTYMMEDPRNIGICTHLLFTAKNVERVGDHTTNIAETVHFLVTGSALTEQRPKGDTTASAVIGDK